MFAERELHVRVIGKGRKERCTPLAKRTIGYTSAWLTEALVQQKRPYYLPALAEKRSPRCR